LFGYEKGAFTDAKAQKRGLAEIADGGTLFLDEIGEIPIQFQAKLLRFLETGDIRRVGGTKDITLNVRILCATNRPLEESIRNRQFREDLYYRLNVLSIRVPALREHAEDIPILISHFITALGFRKEFDAAALEQLKRYSWPGNVRELKNLVERVCIMTAGTIIAASDIAFLDGGRQDTQKSPVDMAEFSQAPDLSLEEMERRHIINVLKFVNGHKGKASEVLKINPKTLYNKMKSYSIVSVYE
jgi:two-component system, NtrC family, nitrogen regulation response regulator NtrX